jgi:hyperosmotically inducible periplasmic protein
MKRSKVILSIVFCATVIVSYSQTPDANTKPDNTAVNKRDRNSGEVTADQQKTNAADQDLTKKVRQSIMSDKSLSSYAHNIKIISQDGSVTLKGPVKSEDEKKTVMEKAVAVAGSPDKVTDEISVKQ